MMHSEGADAAVSTRPWHVRGKRSREEASPPTLSPFLAGCRHTCVHTTTTTSLQAVATLNVPNATRAVTARRDDLVALRAERNLGDLALVTDQDRL